MIVQALDPDARPLRHAAAHDAHGFLRGELSRRQELGYPPFGHLVRIVCSSEEAGLEAAAADAVRSRLQAAGVFAMGPAPLFRRLGRHRAQLVVKSPERAATVAAVDEAVRAVAGDRAHRGAAFAVDVDPQ